MLELRPIQLMKIFWIDPQVHNPYYKEYVDMFKDQSREEGDSGEEDDSTMKAMKVAKKIHDTQYLPF